MTYLECNVINESGCSDNGLTYVVKSIQEAFEKQDENLWKAIVYSEDDLTNSLEENWFVGYVKNMYAQKVTLQIEKVTQDEKIIYANCNLEIKYSQYDTIKEYHSYTIEYVEKVQNYCITWIEKIRQCDAAVTKEKKCFDMHVRSTSMKDWWDQDAYVELTRQFNDKESISVYARCIARNIRFRSAYPILESASILANVMSERVCLLAQQITAKDEKSLLEGIYSAAGRVFSLSITRNDRTNEWSSKFQAPWYGFDEVYYLNKDNDRIRSSCFSYMSFIHALLLIAGIDESNVMQLRIENQDVLLLFLNHETYLISTDNLTRLNKRTLFHFRKVSLLFTSSHYWTNQGESNLSEDDKLKLRQLFETQNVFEFDFQSDGDNRYLSRLNRQLQNQEENLHERILKSIMQFSVDCNDSVYTFAKYAYQTLYVQKPQAYINWSIQNAVIRETVKEFNSAEDAINYIKALEKDTIFLESHRIMTSDQVIRCQCADDRSRAAFLYSILKIMSTIKGGVVFTKKADYCVWFEDEQVRVWNSVEERYVDDIEGEVLLACNERACYFPLIGDKYGYVEDEFILYVVGKSKN